MAARRTVALGTSARPPEHAAETVLRQDIELAKRRAEEWIRDRIEATSASRRHRLRIGDDTAEVIEPEAVAAVSTPAY